MSAPKGPKLELVEATETTIDVAFKPDSSIASYELQWKPIEQQWSNLASTSIQGSSSSSGKKVKAQAIDLQPGTTYCVRLVCVSSGGSKGEPGPELIIDTEQVGCTPKQSSGCACVIQ
mmetsp:Transcript_113809/g.317867  ORF Transcript_113809/g.317867 Transcript_113809/m.317867 type:complete len:118 (-) Transcript_113809:129-482(-)